MSRQGSPLIRRAAGDGPLIKTNSLELVFSSINECLLKLTTRVDSVEQVSTRGPMLSSFSQWNHITFS